MKPHPSSDAVEPRRRAGTRVPGQQPPAPSSAPDTRRRPRDRQVEFESENEGLRNSLAALEAKLARHADLYDFTPVGYFTLQRNSRVSQLNPSGARLLGLERDKATGRHFRRFVARTDQALFDTWLRQVFSRQSRQICEVELLTKNQPSRIVRIEAALSAQGQECHAVAVDITERRKLDLFRQTQQVAGVGGWEFDVAAGKISWTEEVYRIYEVAPGYDPNDIDRAVEFYAPEARSIILNAFRRAVEHAEPYDLELPFMGAQGTLKWIKTTGRVEQAGGKVRRVFGDIIDITAVKARRSELERQVRERTAQLRAMAIELNTTELRERQVLARELHDGLGQTLAIAKLKLTALEPPPRDDAWRDLFQRQISEVETLIDSANQTVRSLSLQLSPPLLHRFGLVPALEWLAEDLRRSYGLRVNVRDDGMPKPLAESLLSPVIRAIRELLINVARHAQVEVAELAAAREKDRLLLSVTDTGVGFAPDDAAVPTTKGGFGLFSVRERIDLIGGEMQIDSRPGDGTVVVLSLPLGTKRRKARK